MKKASRLAACALLVAGALWPDPAAAQSARQVGGVGITVFRDENYRGRNATFLRNVPDLDAYELNDRISSLRVGPGEYWEACEHPKYRGRCQVFFRRGAGPAPRRLERQDLFPASGAPR